MVEYHPSLEQLTDYCSGALPLSHGLCVATHLEYCDCCAQQVKRLNQMGGVLFESLSQKSKVEQFKQQQANQEVPNAELKNKVFAMLDDEPKIDSPPNKASRRGSAVPRSLR